jgi:hypothetical protein
MGILVQFVSVITFTAWGLYVWADVNKFGKDATCNDNIKYVKFFFFTARATAPWLRRMPASSSVQWGSYCHSDGG